MCFGIFSLDDDMIYVMIYGKSILKQWNDLFFDAKIGVNKK